MSLFCVYWIEIIDNTVVSKHSLFQTLEQALKWSEKMRREEKRFVTMASEVSGNCTKMGVDSSTDYQWTKRR